MNGEERNSNKNIPEMKDRKVMLSTLWIFAVLNYIYADVFIGKDPEMVKQLIAGTGPLQMTGGVLFGAAILMETAIAMVLLSRILKYKANRWANIIVGVIHTAAVSLSLFVGTPALYYVFFAAIEIACTLFIIWYAWKWPEQESVVNNKI